MTKMFIKKYKRLISMAVKLSLTIIFIIFSRVSVSASEIDSKEWIDRFDIPNEVRMFYNKLVEGSDNDGIEDFLIEDAYFTGQNYIEVALIEGDADSEEAMQQEIQDRVNSYALAIHAAYHSFLYDHPEVFWLEGTSSVRYSSNWYSDTWKYKVKIYFSAQREEHDVRAVNYRSESSIKKDIAIRDARVAEILEGAEGKDTYEKIVYFNDILTTTNVYNLELAQSGDDEELSDRRGFECISALFVGSECVEPVCSGYAKAFKVLCDASGIPCMSVSGNGRGSLSEEGEDHQWNYVQLDDKWYAVDVTWNDPLMSDEDEGLCSGWENRNWLLLGSDTVVGNINFIDSHQERYISSAMSSERAPTLSVHAYQSMVETKIENISVESQEVWTSDLERAEQIKINFFLNTDKEDANIYDADAIALYLGDTKVASAKCFFIKKEKNGSYLNNYVIYYRTENKEIPDGEQIVTVRFEGKETERAVFLSSEESVQIVIKPITQTTFEEEILEDAEIKNTVDKVNVVEEEKDTANKVKVVEEKTKNIWETFKSWFIEWIESIFSG